MHPAHHHEQKTAFVTLLTAVTMIAEIAAGWLTHSMALLADGIHMGSHVLAIGLSWLAYRMVRKLKHNGDFTGDTDKILSLSGYTSGLLLLVFAFVILVEAFGRIQHPVEIRFREAILVAVVGLLVNLVSALLLNHHHNESDHNIKAAYLHVLADALTSVAAIIGLIGAMLFRIVWLDAAVAVLGSLVIIRWSVGLLKASGKSLLGITGK
ncbi:MAG: cation diffusion facilitator family transporter [Marinilabiliales bacterium]|nr:cation diffusion facilitator family transporter [Marinilabiliales bacterium]